MKKYSNLYKNTYSNKLKMNKNWALYCRLYPKRQISFEKYIKIKFIEKSYNAFLNITGLAIKNLNHEKDNKRN